MKTFNFQEHSPPNMARQVRFTLIGLSALLLVPLFLGCQQPSQNSTPASGAWLIPSGEIYDGGPGKDGIPALTNPVFVNATSVSYLRGNDLVIGLKVGNETRAYPHPILDWHEIINDNPGGKNLAITYCPLTGSGIAWESSSVGGNATTFGVSGLLFNTNLIPYDRATGSEWSQMKLQCVHGKLAGERIKTRQVIETTWATWQKMAPNTVVVSSATGFDRSYGSYPYGDYRTNNNSLIFPVSNDDRRLPRKERVLGLIVGEDTKAYSIKSFSQDVSLVHDEIAGEQIVVVGSSADNFATAFSSTLAETTLRFEAVPGRLPIVMKDDKGNSWTVFGKAISGPNKGQTLTPIEGYIAYWFAWAAFWPSTELHS